MTLMFFSSLLSGRVASVWEIVEGAKDERKAMKKVLRKEKSSNFFLNWKSSGKSWARFKWIKHFFFVYRLQLKIHYTFVTDKFFLYFSHVGLQMKEENSFINFSHLKVA